MGRKISFLLICLSGTLLALCSSFSPRQAAAEDRQEAEFRLQREKMVKQKLNPIRDIVSGKKIAVVDDSIVRGTTSKRIVQLLKSAGAKEVYFVSASPPIKHPCIYGIDMSVRKEILASNYEIDEIARYIGADAVVYQSLEDLEKMYHDLPICHACFSGKYPTGISKQLLQEIEQEKLGSNRA